VAIRAVSLYDEVFTPRFMSYDISCIADLLNSASSTEGINNELMTPPSVSIDRSGSASLEFLDLVAEQAFIFFLSKDFRRVQCTRLANFGVSAGIQQNLDHLGLVLEHHSSQWRLTSIIQSVGVCAVLDEQRD